MSAEPEWRVTNELERRAAVLRRVLGLDPLEVLDPLRLAGHLGAEVYLLGDLLVDRFELRRARSVPFDGMASVEPRTGTPIIVLNCGRDVRRRTATLFEELAHLTLEHEPSSLGVDPTLGVLRRSFDAAQERQAYYFGSATLLPKDRMRSDLALKRTADHIADEHGCSVDLVCFRLKRLRLWRRYAAYALETG